MKNPVLLPRIIMSAENTSGLTTDTGASFTEPQRRPFGLTAALICRVLTGSSPSITGRVEHSASPDSVPDASAVWSTYVTFGAQTSAGANYQTSTNPYFPRLRCVVIRGGTSVTELDYDVVIC